MDMLRAMMIFLRVSNTGSLTAAGRDLGLSQSAVSQQIAALERHLSVRLIQRTTRQLTLTDAGEEFRRRSLSILDAVQEATEMASDGEAALRGALRVHAPVGLGQSHIADAAVRFHQLHPDLELDLVLDDRIADLTAEGVDVAIRLGTLPSSGLVARRLGEVRRILVASPAYMAANGIPESIVDLKQHVQVRFNATPNGDAMPLIGPAGLEDCPVRTVFKANNAYALTRALVAGLGLGAAQMPLIRRELEDGRLQRVLPDYEYAPLEVHAVYPSAHFIPVRVRAFVEFLQTETASLLHS
ncbi:LysR family transcriptional regulator [Thioclava sp. GXIMD4215]|uniref:LysR family transcriptional regulator n=1 Tax=Thioclava sp. GXIMD4215 TaxID=3131928 RepID=UPI00324EC387